MREVSGSVPLASSDERDQNTVSGVQARSTNSRTANVCPKRTTSRILRSRIASSDCAVGHAERAEHVVNCT
jgi:hypothetical protein